VIDVWRLVRRKYCLSPQAAFDGSGAAIAGGRWNRKGTRVAYASWTRSLSVLEILATIDRRDAPSDYVFARARLEESDVTALHALPSDWRSPARSLATIEIGENFVRASVALALAIPSVIVPQESNYIINPRHIRFSALNVLDSFESFHFDDRLFVS
jgi:RES domain-containing protein